VAVGWESVAVISASGWSSIIYDIIVVIFCDSRGRAACVGEGRVTPTAGPEAATHKEEEGEEWKDPNGSKIYRVSVCDQCAGLPKRCA